jgi:DNA-binding winged helix-turn-helix (wHTH) protein
MEEAGTKIIDVFICKLRRKLNAAGANGVIATVWGQGYTLRGADKRQAQFGPTDHRHDELSAVRLRPLAPGHAPSAALAKVTPQLQSRWDGLPQARESVW